MVLMSLGEGVMHDLLLRSTYLACVIGAVEHRLMSSNYLPIYKTEELCHFKYVVMFFVVAQSTARASPVCSN